jgi:U3 small nucleolar RNA-associated protein 14
MREQDIHKTEELKMNHLSVEEVASRRGELRKMRELMFRAEVKAKRVAKIKSKTYRKIKKKEREKMAQALGDDEEDEEALRLKREVERARERATLRHKNTGKWAKAMKARGELGVNERKEISDMLDRGEMLRRRIRGQKGSDSEGESSDDESDRDGGGDGEDDGDRILRIKASAFEELERINASDTRPESGNDKKNSIFEMKFMKDAMARDQQKTDHMLDDFIKEMGGGRDTETDTEEAADEKDTEPSIVAVERTGGRVVYRPGDMVGILLVLSCVMSLNISPSAGQHVII